MKYIEIRTNWSKKLSTLGTLSAVALAPFFAVTPTAEAAPPDHAPANGYRRNKADRDQRRQDRQERREDRSDRRNDTLSFNGTVTRDLAGNQFEVRTDNNRIVRVQTQVNEPNRLSRGDRVQVTGYLREGVIIAQNLRLLENNDGDDNDWDDNGWNNNNSRTTLTGVVTRDLSGDREFELRAQNGRIYRVTTAYDEPGSLSVGDRVQVSGRLSNNNRFYANSIRMLAQNGNGGWNGGNGGWNNGNNNRQVLTGVVTRDLQGNRFVVRTDRGSEVIVQSSRPEPLRLSIGDRVTLRGAFRGGKFIANNTRITEDDDRDENGSSFTFNGRVTSVESSTRLVVRADNGRTYTVQSNTAFSSAITDGDRVRISGYVSRRNGSVLRADSVTLLRDRDDRDRTPSGNGQTVNFRGEITDKSRNQSGADTITVRGDNGQTYEVRVDDAGDFKRGQRVRVSGTWRNGVVTNSTVTGL